MNWESDYSIVDIETAGPGPHGEEIVEIGLIRFGPNGKEKSRFHSIVKPRISIIPETSEKHGLRDEDVENCKPIGEVIVEAIENLSGSYWIAFNSKFDAPILCKEALLAGIKLPNDIIIDLYRVVRILYPDLPKYSLQYLFHYFKLPRPKSSLGVSHNALYDVEVTKYLLEFALKENNIEDDAQLLEYSLSPIPIKKFLFGKHKGQDISSVPSQYINWWINQRPAEDTDDLDLIYSMMLEENKKCKRGGGDEIYPSSEMKKLIQRTLVENSMVKKCAKKQPIIR